MGLLCQKWLLHWSSPGFILLLQTGQCRQQESSYLHYNWIPPFLPFCPCTVHRGLNCPWPSGCCRSTCRGGTSHKYLPSGRNRKSSRYLWIMVPELATRLPAHAFLAASLSKRATPWTSKGLFAVLPTPGLHYPSPLCRLTWAVKHVIGLHVELTILGKCDLALTTILGILISNIVLMVDTRAH